MSKVREETALAVREESSGELAPTAHAAAVQAEVQASIIVAKRFPRNEDVAYEKLMKACKRTSFADEAIYSYPRGGTDIEGPSVNLAREAARVWGNVEYGFVIVRDEEDERHLRGWAWDKETNTRNFSEASFNKIIFRKGKGNVIPDERDLRELTNKHGAILERNAVLKTIPKDFVEDAMTQCRETLKKDAEQDPDAARKRLILAFSEFNVTPGMLEGKLGHPLSECTPKEIADLRKVYTSIKDGNTTWHNYVSGQPAPPNGGQTKPEERGTLRMEDLAAPKLESAAANPGQGAEQAKGAPLPPAAEKPEECSRSDFDQIEILATECGVRLKQVKDQVAKMGVDPYGALPKARLQELRSWIEANRTRKDD